MNQKWSDLTIKEKIATVAIISSLVIGWSLTVTDFFLEPIGNVNDSTLWILGQVLVYSGSFFGLAVWTRSEIAEQLKNIRK